MLITGIVFLLGIFALIGCAAFIVFSIFELLLEKYGLYKQREMLRLAVMMGADFAPDSPEVRSRKKVRSGFIQKRFEKVT